MRTVANKRSVSCAVRAAVGSSITSTRASSARALAISTRWRLPTDSDPTTVSTPMSCAPSCASSSAARVRMASQSMRKPDRKGAWPRKMFSATVRSGNCSSSWWMVAIPRRWACAGPSSATRCPSISMWPASGVCTPARTLIRVDLPAPFSPSRAWTSPARRSKLTSVSAATPGKPLLTPARRTTGAVFSDTAPAGAWAAACNTTPPGRGGGCG